MILNAADDSAAVDNSYSVVAQNCCVQSRVDCRLMGCSMNVVVPMSALPDSECMDGRYSASCTSAEAVAVDSDNVVMRKLVAKAVQV